MTQAPDAELVVLLFALLGPYRPLASLSSPSSIWVKPLISRPVSFRSSHPLKLSRDISCRFPITFSPHASFHTEGNLLKAIFTTVGELISPTWLQRLRVVMMSLIPPIYWSNDRRSPTLIFGNLAILAVAACAMRRGLPYRFLKFSSAAWYVLGCSEARISWSGRMALGTSSSVAASGSSRPLRHVRGL